MNQVFVSHTKKDEKFCDVFDRVCAGVGIKRFRSEFEAIGAPPWKTIKEAINNSIALFFLVGKKLQESQKHNIHQWKFTQNWIAYEIGLACQKGIDVWAICDDVLINFPMPYVNNYLTVSLKHRSAFDYLRNVVEKYEKGETFKVNYINQSGKNISAVCPHDGCKLVFNLHVKIKSISEAEDSRLSRIRCPQCLGDMYFFKGHPR